MIEVLEVGLKEMRDNSNLTYSYWYVTGVCNYECDYCDIFHNEQIKEWSLKKRIIDFFNYWGTQRKQKVLLYGGEPTLDPDFPRIVAGLNDYVRIFTNLSKDIEYWKDLSSIRDDMTISISYHMDKTEPDVLLDKVMYLVEQTKIKVRIKIMGDSRKKELCLSQYNLFKNLYNNEPRYECFFDLVFPNGRGNTGAEWVEDDVDWILPLQDYQTQYLVYRENGIVKERETSWNEMRSTLLESNHYYHCMAGVNTIFVNSNGDVYVCKSHKETPLFNVEDDYTSFPIPQDGIICDYMGFCCETEIPKKLVCRRKVNEQTKVIRSLLQ